MTIDGGELRPSIWPGHDPLLGALTSEGATMKRWRIVTALSLFLVLMVQGNASADISQLGARPTDGDQTAGVRSTVSLPAKVPNDGWHRYYWPGLFLKNNDFLQGGYADVPECGGIEWFYASFNSIGTNVQAHNGGCANIGGPHTFTIVQEGGADAAGHYNWVFRIDGVRYDSTLSGSSYGYTVNTYAISEISGGTLNAQTLPYLPPVTYSPAVQKYNCSSGCAWYTPTHGVVYRDGRFGSYTPCPPLYISRLGGDAMRPFTGTGTCLYDGASLW